MLEFELSFDFSNRKCKGFESFIGCLVLGDQFVLSLSFHYWSFVGGNFV